MFPRSFSYFTCRLVSSCSNKNRSTWKYLHSNKKQLHQRAKEVPHIPVYIHLVYTYVTYWSAFTPSLPWFPATLHRGNHFGVYCAGESWDQQRRCSVAEYLRGWSGSTRHIPRPLQYSRILRLCVSGQHAGHFKHRRHRTKRGTDVLVTETGIAPKEVDNAQERTTSSLRADGSSIEIICAKLECG